MTGDREVPEGVSRPHLRVHETVRDYTKAEAKEDGITMSQKLEEWFPDDDLEIHFDAEDDICHMKVSPAMKDRVRRMTGSNVTQNDVVTLFVLLGAVENGDLDVAHDLLQEVPTLIWDVLNDFSTSVMGVEE